MLYAYDPTGSYLLTVTGEGGKVTSYAYATDGPPAQLHALTSVARGGTTIHYTYDMRGRLDSTYRAAGEPLIRFGYDTRGACRGRMPWGPRSITTTIAVCW